MIFYPLETLVRAGIKEIQVVTGGNNAGDFLRLLGNGSEWGLKRLDYTYQRGEGGIAAALSLSESFVDGEPFVIILGDNILEDDISAYVAAFRRQEHGARLLLKEIDDPERFGVVEICDGKLMPIEEKPQRPKSSYAVTGVYLYDAAVFDIIRTLKPSHRGELEITDVNNTYIAQGTATYDILPGWWTDAGTFESLHRANQLVAEQARDRVSTS
jgi:glucose-1-phosphate thymidylyltransferase